MKVLAIRMNIGKKFTADKKTGKVYSTPQPLKKWRSDYFAVLYSEDEPSAEELLKVKRFSK